MTKRQQLDYDNETLVRHLKASTGQGMNALFPGPSPTPQLSDSSVVEQQPLPGKQPADRITQPISRTDERLAGRSEADMWIIPDIPKKRRPERYAFQFWADQIARLKKLNQLLNLLTNLDDQPSTTLSDLVRKALDDYLDTRIKELQQRLPEQDRVDDRLPVRTVVRTNDRTAVLPAELSAP